MRLNLTKIFKKVPESDIEFVQELPGANTQANIFAPFFAPLRLCAK